jgi:hypothetical protein
MPAFQPVPAHATPGLRFISAEDAGAMFQLFSDAEAVRYWSCPPWQDMKQASDYITQTLPMPTAACAGP